MACDHSRPKIRLPTTDRDAFNRSLTIVLVVHVKVRVVLDVDKATDAVTKRNIGTLWKIHGHSPFVSMLEKEIDVIL